MPRSISPSTYLPCSPINEVKRSRSAVELRPVNSEKSGEPENDEINFKNVSDIKNDSDQFSGAEEAKEFFPSPSKFNQARLLSQVVPSRVVPSTILDKVNLIMRHVRPPNVKNTSDLLMPPQPFYGAWGLASLPGTLSSSDVLWAGNEPPSATSWFPWIVGHARIFDGILTYQDYIKAGKIKDNERSDCLVYLNAIWAKRALTELKESVKESDLSQEEINEIKSAISIVEALAKEKRETFLNFVPDKLKIREWVGLGRDAGLGVVGTGHSLNVLATFILGDKAKLLSTAKDFAGVVPFIGGSLSAISGITGVVQGVAELIDGKNAAKALKEAEDFDKHVFADYFNKFPELESLIRHRQNLRDLQLDLAKLLKLHGGFRVGNGCIGLGAAVAALIIVAGGASAGIAYLVAGLTGGAFLLWANIRATLARNAQNKFDKTYRAISAVNDNPEGIPGLPTDKSLPSIQEIAQNFSEKLNNPVTRGETIEMLVKLGIPDGVVNSEPVDVKELAKYLVPSRGITVPDRVALSNVYTKSKTAEERLRVVQAWLDHKELKKVGVEHIAKKTVKDLPHWSRHLKTGSDMGDPGKSKLTLELIRELWDEQGFKSYMQKSLNLEEGVVLSGPDDAWRLLKSRRETTMTQEKASAAVAALINGTKVDAIQRCLNSLKKDPMTLACKDVLKVRFAIDENCKHKEGIKAALRDHVSKTTLDVNTIGNFMAVYKATLEQDKAPLLNVMNDFLQKTHDQMNNEEQKKFNQMLDVTGDFRSLSAKEMDAILGKVHKFLLVSKKLQGQTLTKVIASLHKYPTNRSYPHDVVQLAALRELRIRCSLGNPEDVKHTLALAKELSRGELHKRAFGPGKGGGVLGFFGYRLNEKGVIVEELVKRCLGQGSPINSFSASMAKQLRANHSNEPAYIAALTYWTNKLIGTGEETNLSKLADRLDLYRTPGKLETALKRNDLSADGPEMTCLNYRLNVAKEELKSTASVLKDHTKWREDDSSRFVTQLTEFFSLEKIARNYNIKVNVMELGLPLELKDRLDHYRAALEYNNNKARAKNIRAIKWEFDNLKTGNKLAANPFWSAKFLNSRTELRTEVFKEMEKRYDWLSKADSYKRFVKKVNEIASMNTSRLTSALKKNDPVGDYWIYNQFVTYGLEKPTLETLIILKNVAKNGDLSLLEKIAKIRDDAFLDKLNNKILDNLPKVVSA